MSRHLMLIVAMLLRGANAHSCDAEAATACPFDGGRALGACLRDPTKHESPTEISAECQVFLDLHTKCETNLASGTCGGTAYTDDAILCLTQWLNKADLTEECKAALPEEKPAEERVLDEEALAKRARRKRARAKAAEEVRKFTEDRARESEEQSAKEQKNKRKKASKRKAAPITDDEL